jgi:hypothetical protein
LYLHFHLSLLNHLSLKNRLLPLCPKFLLNRSFLRYLKNPQSLK